MAYINRIITLISLIVIAFNSKVTNAQEINDFGFTFWPSVKVSVQSNQIPNPWSGGLNNIQTGAIDLNNDGSNDLVVFDKHGNRLLPFVFSENTGQYLYAPEYIDFFPPVNSLFQLHDYNGDAKPDLFTYTTGGIMVYRNITDTDLKFEKAVKQFITSLQGEIFTNLLITNVDYPALKDLDTDGDLDIITFWGLGSFIELHKNMSIEIYGTADSLLFHKIDYCWGEFAEHPESNNIILDTCTDFKNTPRHNRHTGSTLSLVDINNDGLEDLLLGDVDYLNLQALINGGNNMHAEMTSVIDSFPSNAPISLHTFPVVQQLDIYNDGMPDLIVSSFDPGMTKSSGKESIWLYTKTNGQYLLKTKNFLQNTMIDAGIGSYPVFEQLTSDTSIDLVVGNFGTISNSFYNSNGQLITEFVSKLQFYKNTSRAAVPAFELVDDDFANLSVLNKTALIPAFTDFNNDNLPDLLIGTSDGQLLLFFCTGYSNGIPEYNMQYQIVASDASAKHFSPTCTDLDNDGLTDILAGKEDGKISFYRNKGTKVNPSFQLVTDYYGQINVTETGVSYTGFSTPAIYNNKGKLQLFVGSESGRIFYYPQLPLNHYDEATYEEDVFSTLQDGIRTSISMRDINADTYPDLVIGNFSGGLKLFKGKMGEPHDIPENITDQSNERLVIVPNPANQKIQIKLPTPGNWDIRVIDLCGRELIRKTAQGKSVLADVELLRSGIYIIVASQQFKESDIYTGKLIIIQ